MTIEKIEYFDVVDEKDQIIDRQPRDVVHRQHLNHRAVHALVYDFTGEQVYLQKRAMDKDINPGVWDSSVGGHVESGETYDQAILREAKEELGIEISALPVKLFQLQPQPLTGNEFIWVYRINHQGPFELCQREIEKAAWFAVDDLSSQLSQQVHDFSPTFKLIWQTILDNNNG